MNENLVDTSTISETFRGDNRIFSGQLVEIVREMRDYWPLTVRQVYYQAVAGQMIDNHQSQYRRVSQVLVKLREIELVPWRAIEDRSRRTIDKRGVQNLQVFAAEQLDAFMNPDYYHRCLIQDQDVYVEVATEKDALSAIIEDAVWMYCTRVNVVRGQGSATIVEQMARRYDKAIMRGKKAVLVYLGDLDPSGMGIPRAIIRNLEERHGLKVELQRAALNPDQVAKYALPGDPMAAKQQDPNYKKWLEEFGPEQPSVELDALHPNDLKEITASALHKVYDIHDMTRHSTIESKERELMQEIRYDIEDFLYGRYPSVFVDA